MFNECDREMLERVEQKLDGLLKQEAKFMAEVRQDVKDVIAKFDAETTKISDRLDKLIQQSTGLTADEKAAFQAVADHLDVLGTDPVNPVPPLPPSP